MDENILDSIKKLLGIDGAGDVFDEDVKIAINSSIMILRQVGLGPSVTFIVDSGDETWQDFLGAKIDQLPAVKDYIYLRARLFFDPPTSSTLLQNIKDLVSELEWRLGIEGDPVDTFS